ncbi:MAG: 50S ribosomal protein L11 methyltransferase [Methanobrevibacter sp.]|nr:50S ribosomal protein L11 methyltransferase [Candidatus Methanoflexus mossambicus]
MELKCLCDNNCIISKKNIENGLKSISPCPRCVNISLNRHKAIKDQLCLPSINNDFGRCICGKRPLDVVMAHVLKVMNDFGYDIDTFKLHDCPVPLPNPFKIDNNPYSPNNTIHLEKNSLILLYPDFNNELAEKIISEVDEVKSILKGSSRDLVGIINTEDHLKTYEVLSGCDFRCEIIDSPKGRIAINKEQSKVHLEFSPSIENKILKLESYFKAKHLTKDEVSKMTVLDATCGCGALGIFSLLFGFKTVVFNDINKYATKMTEINLESNGFRVESIENPNENNLIGIGNKFKVYNLKIEDLHNIIDVPFDICIIDTFPQSDDEYFYNIAKTLAKEVFMI